MSGEQITEITYEAFGPSGSALIINVLTDNKNRALNEIKGILKKYQAHLGISNSALRLFKRQGVIRLPLNKIVNQETAELKIIESGAEDIKTKQEELVVYTQPDKLQKVQEKLIQDQLPIDYAEIELVPHEPIQIINTEKQAQLEKLLEELNDCPDVSNVYSNFK